MHFETTFAGNIFFHLSTRQAKYRLYLLNDKRVKNKCYFTEARIRLSDCGVICRNKAICFNGTRWKRSGRVRNVLLTDITPTVSIFGSAYITRQHISHPPDRFL